MAHTGLFTPFETTKSPYYKTYDLCLRESYRLTALDGVVRHQVAFCDLELRIAKKTRLYPWYNRTQILHDVYLDLKGEK